MIYYESKYGLIKILYVDTKIEQDIFSVKYNINGYVGGYPSFIHALPLFAIKGQKLLNASVKASYSVQHRDDLYKILKHNNLYYDFTTRLLLNDKKTSVVNSDDLFMGFFDGTADITYVKGSYDIRNNTTKLYEWGGI
jgi:hypothetical protein